MSSYFRPFDSLYRRRLARPTPLSSDYSYEADDAPSLSSMRLGQLAPELEDSTLGIAREALSRTPVLGDRGPTSVYEPSEPDLASLHQLTETAQKETSAPAQPVTGPIQRFPAQPTNLPARQGTQRAAQPVRQQPVQQPPAQRNLSAQRRGRGPTIRLNIKDDPAQGNPLAGMTARVDGATMARVPSAPKARPKDLFTSAPNVDFMASGAMDIGAPRAAVTTTDSSRGSFQPPAPAGTREGAMQRVEAMRRSRQGRNPGVPRQLAEVANPMMPNLITPGGNAMLERQPIDYTQMQDIVQPEVIGDPASSAIEGISMGALGPRDPLPRTPLGAFAKVAAPVLTGVGTAKAIGGALAASRFGSQLSPMAFEALQGGGTIGGMTLAREATSGRLERDPLRALGNVATESAIGAISGGLPARVSDLKSLPRQMVERAAIGGGSQLGLDLATGKPVDEAATNAAVQAIGSMGGARQVEAMPPTGWRGRGRLIDIEQPSPPGLPSDRGLPPAPPDLPPNPSDAPRGYLPPSPYEFTRPEQPIAPPPPRSRPMLETMLPEEPRGFVTREMAASPQIRGLENLPDEAIEQFAREYGQINRERAVLDNAYRAGEVSDDLYQMMQGQLRSRYQALVDETSARAAAAEPRPIEPSPQSKFETTKLERDVLPAEQRYQRSLRGAKAQLSRLAGERAELNRLRNEGMIDETEYRARIGALRKRAEAVKQAIDAEEAQRLLDKPTDYKPPARGGASPPPPPVRVDASSGTEIKKIPRLSTGPMTPAKPSATAAGEQKIDQPRRRKTMFFEQLDKLDSKQLEAVMAEPGFPGALERQQILNKISKGESIDADIKSMPDAVQQAFRSLPKLSKMDETEFRRFLEENYPDAYQRYLAGLERAGKLDRTGAPGALGETVALRRRALEEGLPFAPEGSELKVQAEAEAAARKTRAEERRKREAIMRSDPEVQEQLRQNRRILALNARQFDTADDFIAAVNQASKTREAERALRSVYESARADREGTLMEFSERSLRALWAAGNRLVQQKGEKATRLPLGKEPIKPIEGVTGKLGQPKPAPPKVAPPEPPPPAPKASPPPELPPPGEGGLAVSRLKPGDQVLSATGRLGELAEIVDAGGEAYAKVRFPGESKLTIRKLNTYTKVGKAPAAASEVEPPSPPQTSTPTAAPEAPAAPLAVYRPDPGSKVKLEEAFASDEAMVFKERTQNGRKEQEIRPMKPELSDVTLEISGKEGESFSVTIYRSKTASKGSWGGRDPVEVPVVGVTRADARRLAVDLVRNLVRVEDGKPVYTPEFQAYRSERIEGAPIEQRTPERMDRAGLKRLFQDTFQARVDGRPAYTDGRILILDAPPAGVEPPLRSGEPLEPNKAVQGWLKGVDEAADLKPIGFVERTPGSPRDSIVFDNGTVMDARYYDGVRALYPDVIWRQPGRSATSPFVGMVGGEPRVIMMPMRISPLGAPLNAYARLKGQATKQGRRRLDFSEERPGEAGSTPIFGDIADFAYRAGEKLAGVLRTLKQKGLFNKEIPASVRTPFAQNVAGFWKANWLFRAVGAMGDVAGTQLWNLSRLPGSNVASLIDTAMANYFGRAKQVAGQRLRDIPAAFKAEIKGAKDFWDILTTRLPVNFNELDIDAQVKILRDKGKLPKSFDELNAADQEAILKQRRWDFFDEFSAAGQKKFLSDNGVDLPADLDSMNALKQRTILRKGFRDLYNRMSFNARKRMLRNHLPGDFEQFSPAEQKRVVEQFERFRDTYASGFRPLDAYNNLIPRARGAIDAFNKAYAMEMSLRSQSRLIRDNFDRAIKRPLELDRNYSPEQVREIEQRILDTRKKLDRMEELIAARREGRATPTELEDLAVIADSMIAKAGSDAEVVTFNNDNKIATAINSLKEKGYKGGFWGKSGAFLLDITVAFPKVATNVLARLYDLTPLPTFTEGTYRVGRSLVEQQRLKGTEGFKDKSFRERWERTFTPKDQEILAKMIGDGAVGSALFAIGVGLYMSGAQSEYFGYVPGSAESKQKFYKSEAARRYPGSINIGGVELDIRRFQPLANAMTIGAEMARAYRLHQLEKGGRAGAVGSALWEGTKTGVGMFFEHPLMEGVAEKLEILRNSDKFGEGLANVAAESAGNFVPGIGRDLSPLIAPLFGYQSVKRLKTKGKDDLLGGMRDAFIEKLPVVREAMLQPDADAFGRQIPNQAKDIIDFTRSRPGFQSPAIRKADELDVGLNKATREEGEPLARFAQRKAQRGRLYEANLNRAVQSAPMAKAARPVQKLLFGRAGSAKERLSGEDIRREALGARREYINLLRKRAGLPPRKY